MLYLDLWHFSLFNCSILSMGGPFLGGPVWQLCPGPISTLLCARVILIADMFVVQHSGRSTFVISMLTCKSFCFGDLIFQILHLQVHILILAELIRQS